jgi:beta-galactosidase/beta-glucuronidase
MAADGLRQYDVEVIKAFGLNAVRVHQIVRDERW